MAVYTDTIETGVILDADRHGAYHQVLSNASKSGVIMLGIYVNTPERTAYFLFEADNTGQIADVFQPILDFGHIESVPVVDRLAL
jgi:hypothetical protein